MKKKLIAIVASLAMVATMVPASAFAAVSTEGGTSTLGNGATLSLNKTVDPGDVGEAWIVELKAKMTNLDGTFSNGTLKVKGYLPYMEIPKTANQYNTKALNDGHFITVDTFVPAVADTENVKAYGMLDTSVEQDFGDGGSWENAKGTPYRINKLNVKAVETGRSDKDVLFRLDDDMPKLSRMICYFSQAGLEYINAEPANLKLWKEANGTKSYRFGNEADVTGAGSPEKYNRFQALNDLLDGKTTAPPVTDYVLGTKTLTMDLSDVTLLSKADTGALEDFVGTIKAIEAKTTTTVVGATGISPDLSTLSKVQPDNEVNADYIRLTDRARYTYDKLTATQKDAIAYAVDNETGSNEDKAYNALLQAEKNIEAYNTLDAVATLIKAVPDAKTLDLTNAEDVAKVTAANRAYSKLPEGAKSVLEDTTNGYLTKTQLDNFKSAADKVGKADMTAVENEIAALKDLPATFTDQQTVETYAAPLRKALDDFEALGDKKDSVSNKAKLTRYASDYEARMKKYVNPIWEELVEIDVKAGLKPEERAKVAELKSYIDNEYVETAWIDDPAFVKKTYDALVEALNGANENVYSLEKATVEAIAEQTYTGKAIKPAIVVKDGEGNEIAAENYYVSYDNNLEVGEATVTIVAKATSDYYGEATATFTIKPAALTADMVKVANATYTGKALKPAVSVASGVDYTVAYKNNTAVGKASAVVTGTGNYTGTITKNFIVKPAKESITSLKAGKKQITVAYKAQTGAKYRVICKASGLKAIGTNTTATKKTVKKLKSGKTYQVKVRAYKAVDGKTYYGTYSAVKKVKVK